LETVYPVFFEVSLPSSRTEDGSSMAFTQKTNIDISQQTGNKIGLPAPWDPKSSLTYNGWHRETRSKPTVGPVLEIIKINSLLRWAKGGFLPVLKPLAR
jgi:hypothetical protein